MQILLCLKERKVCTYLKHRLAYSGHMVYETSDANAAIALLKGGVTPAAAIVEAELEGKSGLYVLGHIGANKLPVRSILIHPEEEYRGDAITDVVSAHGWKNVRKLIAKQNYEDVLVEHINGSLQAEVCPNQ